MAEQGLEDIATKINDRYKGRENVEIHVRQGTVISWNIEEKEDLNKQKEADANSGADIEENFCRFYRDELCFRQKNK